MESDDGRLQLFEVKLIRFTQQLKNKNLKGLFVYYCITHDFYAVLTDMKTDMCAFVSFKLSITLVFPYIYHIFTTCRGLM